MSSPSPSSRKSMSDEDELNHGSTIVTNLSPSSSPSRSSSISSRSSSTIIQCPYKQFPRGIESPSGDSGIESSSGACSSPARSEETDVVYHNNHHSQNNHPHHSFTSPNNTNNEDMPVLKRALQAPPMIDTNLLMSEAYRPHKKFRYTRSPSTTAVSPVTTYDAPHTMIKQESLQHQQQSHSKSSQHHHHHQQQQQPHQLYPQLASALTQPRLNSSKLISSHSTLAKTLNEKSKLMTQESVMTSDLLHSLIMKEEEEAEYQSQQQQTTQFDPNGPLNLSKKIICQ